MTSLAIVMCAVIGPTEIQVPYETTIDVDANANANTHASEM
jgi:hypothetical protein